MNKDHIYLKRLPPNQKGRSTRIPSSTGCNPLHCASHCFEIVFYPECFNQKESFAMHLSSQPACHAYIRTLITQLCCDICSSFAQQDIGNVDAPKSRHDVGLPQPHLVLLSSPLAIYQSTIHSNLPHDLSPNQCLQFLSAQLLLLTIEVEELLWDRLGRRLIVWIMIRLEVGV